VASERSWGRAWRDFAPVAAVLALCPVVALLAPGPAVPLSHIRALVDEERALGLFFEPSLHRWAAAHPPLLLGGQIGYVVAHVPVLLSVLVWVWVARPAAFRLVRDAFVATQAIALLGYLLVPTAPPRMIAGLGYEDVASLGTHGIERLLMSPYAAMPSGHAAFALLVAGTVFTLARPWPVRALALLYPLGVLAEIMATGNHIWLDALGGTVTAAAGFAIAKAVQRAPRLQVAPQIEG
jgi:hypothetical protein